MKATFVLGGMIFRRLRSRVVLPVPTSPVNKTKPPFESPYKRCESASSCLSLRNKNSGSGAIEKGSADRLKCSRYICGLCHFTDLLIFLHPNCFDPARQGRSAFNIIVY